MNNIVHNECFLFHFYLHVHIEISKGKYLFYKYVIYLQIMGILFVINFPLTLLASI